MGAGQEKIFTQPDSIDSFVDHHAIYLARFDNYPLALKNCRFDLDIETGHPQLGKVPETKWMGSRISWEICWLKFGP